MVQLGLFPKKRRDYRGPDSGGKQSDISKRHEYNPDSPYDDMESLALVLRGQAENVFSLATRAWKF
jgi:hypothetical protein